MVEHQNGTWNQDEIPAHLHRDELDLRTSVTDNTKETNESYNVKEVRWNIALKSACTPIELGVQVSVQPLIS